MKNYESILNELIETAIEYGIKPYYKNGEIHSGQCATRQMERLDAEGWKCTSTSGTYSRPANHTEAVDPDDFFRIEYGGYKFRVVDGIIYMR